MCVFNVTLLPKVPSTTQRKIFPCMRYVSISVGPRKKNSRNLFSRRGLNRWNLRNIAARVRCKVRCSVVLILPNKLPNSIYLCIYAVSVFPILRSICHVCSELLSVLSVCSVCRVCPISISCLSCLSCLLCRSYLSRVFCLRSLS